MVTSSTKASAPLDSEGQELSDSNWAEFLKTAGKWFLGQSDFTEHVTRDYQLTLLIDKCVQLKRDPEHCLLRACDKPSFRPRRAATNLKTLEVHTYHDQSQFIENVVLEREKKGSDNTQHV